MNKRIFLFTLPIAVLIISLVVVLMDQQPSDFESLEPSLAKCTPTVVGDLPQPTGPFCWVNDKGQFVRTYHTPHADTVLYREGQWYGNSTVDAAGNPVPDLDWWEERTGERSAINCTQRPDYANWAESKSDEALNQMVRDIVTDWAYIIGDIEFVEAGVDEAASYIFIRTGGSFVGTSGVNTCGAWRINQAGFSLANCTSTDPIDWQHDCRLRGEVLKESGASIVGSWAKGGVSRTLMGVMSHEFGHTLGLGHAGGVMGRANTNGAFILIQFKETNSAINIHDHGCPDTSWYTLTDFLQSKYEKRIRYGMDAPTAKTMWETDYINFYENCSVNPDTNKAEIGTDPANFPIRPVFAEPIPDPIPEPEKELLVKGDPTDTYTVASYTVTVDGEIRKGLLANPNDIISEDGITVTGKVLPIGTDSYFFTGNITSITANDHVFTFVDGVEIPNDSTSRIDIDLIKPKLDEMKLLIAELEALL